MTIVKLIPLPDGDALFVWPDTLEQPAWFVEGADVLVEVEGEGLDARIVIRPVLHT